MACPDTVFSNPPHPPHIHAMPTQPHIPPPHAGAVGLSPLWRRAQAPCAACGINSRRRCCLPPHPPLPPPLPHTTCAAAMHTAAAEPTAGARATTPERCCRYCLCCSLPPLLPLRCCRCKYVNIQSWLTSAASNYVNQNVHIAKRFHCFLARFKISAMGGMEYYQEKINC